MFSFLPSVIITSKRWEVQKFKRFYSVSSTDSNNIKPTTVYPNADLNKKDIMKDNRKKVGIYRWINNINGKTSVGSSIDITVRMYTYFSLRSLEKSNRPIDRALLKYGYSNFSLEILEYTDKNNVLAREQYYLDLLIPEYNIVETAGNTLGYKHTPETLAKFKNRVYSEDVKNKWREAIILATAARKTPVIVKNINTNEEILYSSTADAGRALGVTRYNISYAISSLVKKTYLVRKYTI